MAIAMLMVVAEVDIPVEVLQMVLDMVAVAAVLIMEVPVKPTLQVFKQETDLSLSDIVLLLL